MEEEPLIQLDTNSADDSRGIAFGLQGNLFLAVAVAGFISIAMLTLLLASSSVSIPAAFGISAVPFVSVLLFILLFLNNKPPHYLADVWNTLISEPCVSRPTYQPKHPLTKAREALSRRSRK